MVLFSTTLLFMMVRSSLAKMLAVTNQAFDIIEELKSAYEGLILGSGPVKELSLLLMLAFGFIARGKNVLRHPFIYIRPVCRTVFKNFRHIHLGI